MNNNAWFKKENPFQTVIGFGGGATGFGAHSSSTSTKYVDEVFSTDVWIGNETARTISTGVDNNKGALVWVKSRNDSHDHHVIDTARGANQLLYTNSTDAETNTANRITGFSNDGYSIGTAGQVNGTSAYTYGGWNFRKATGFFDVITWTGDNSGQRNISHSLGSKPGMIIARQRDGAASWHVWHRYLVNDTSILELNNSSAVNTGSDAWGWPTPSFTSTSFSVDNRMNDNGDTYVAYVFAGGEDQGNASVKFNGKNNLTIHNDSTGSSGIDFGSHGSSDFTMECWIKVQTSTSPGNHDVICASSLYLTGTGNSFTMYAYDNGGIRIFRSASGSWTADACTSVYSLNTWTHIAWVRSGSGTNNNKVYVNGTKEMEFTDNMAYTTGQDFYLGASDYSQNGTPDEYGLTGNISNFRFIDGEALYTADFTPSTTPLTTTSQGATASKVGVLCCNSTGASGGYIRGHSTTFLEPTGGATGSTDSPFTTSTDSAAIFGENEDKNLITTGRYVGNGSSSDGVTIDLGWEPQWLLIKNTDLSTESWWLLDDIRGIRTGSTEATLQPNVNNAEWEVELIRLTSTGFKCTTSDDKVNGSGHSYIYTAIRRPDGDVGKPAESGTDVFTMDTGSSNSDIPDFDSGFPVDFSFFRTPASTQNAMVQTRLMGHYGLETSSSNVEFANSMVPWDCNTGWATHWNSNYQSWMWKRGQGFDVVAYKGYDPSGVREIRHNLGRVPEMIWMKARDYAGSWSVYHKGLNGGTNPEQYYMNLNSDAAEASSSGPWNNTAPTSTHWTVGNDNAGNGTYEYLALLFASVEGISKLGSYDGTGSEFTVTTGFQPRFVLIKATNNTRGWTYMDTLRGWSSGVDNKIYLNDSAAQVNTWNYGEPTANGFKVSADPQYDINYSGWKYIYYAHA